MLYADSPVSVLNYCLCACTQMVSVHFDPDGKDLFTVPPPLSEITKQGFSESSQPHSKNKTLQGESVDTKVKDGLAEIKIPVSLVCIRCYSAGCKFVVK